MPTLKFPLFPELTTERLLLREITYSDAIALFEMRSDERVMAYIHRGRPKTEADIQTLIVQMEENYREDKGLVWAIALKENPGQMIGSIGYYRADLPNYRAEVGYLLSPQYWRMGIVSEALIAVVNFGFEQVKLHSIFANIDPSNHASRQLLLKQGFEKEAFHRENFYFNGKFLDTEVYGLLKEGLGKYK